MASNILSWQGRQLKLNTRADIEPLLAGIDPTLIEEIHLGGNTVGIEAAQALAEFLSKATSIKVADFADIFTGRLITEIPPALSAICDALIDKTSLVEINLSDNAFGGRSVNPMVPFLTQNRSFQVLKLNNNGLGPAGGEIIANALLKSAELSRAEGKPSNLRVVICGRNRLENGSAPAWAAAFAAHGGLEEVRMPQNGIRMSGITALANGLAKNAGLLHVDLQDNTFTEEGDLSGVAAWAAALKAWPALHTLNLSDCVLSGEGEVPAVIEALVGGSNPKLHTLQLQNNNLEAATFEQLADAIAGELATLRRLELQWNEQEEDDEFLAKIAESLKTRGGKLFATDEDEEEEDEVSKEDVEDEPAAAIPPAPPVVAAEQEKQQKTVSDKATDDLADLLSKVSIKST
ncbi:RNI-like protein [Schizophyllum commune Loenen D]|nr:RNI-like protein [Schizophyllum commune Loenen D]